MRHRVSNIRCYNSTDMINKIYIIGGARSGKSFLGEHLSDKTAIKHYDLDKVVFIEIGETLRNELDRDNELKKILLDDSWIIGGVYTEDWITPALEKADKIIWLDIFTPIKLFRFLKQSIKKGKVGFKNFYGRGKLAIGLKYEGLDRSRIRYKNLLGSFEDKVIIVKSKKDLENLLKSIC